MKSPEPKPTAEAEDLAREAERNRQKYWRVIAHVAEEVWTGERKPLPLIP